jgi:hypothetical protein
MPDQLIVDEADRIVAQGFGEIETLSRIPLDGPHMAESGV